MQAICPACAAPVVFNIDSSVVTKCKACDSLLARGDQKIEDLGKVAQLAETGAALEVGGEGVYEGKRFMLTGRTQLKHEAGGLWDEWYAAFTDGRWGWLAEAQGHYYLTFERMAPLENAPSFDALELGKAVPAIKAKSELVVQEKGVAEAVSAEGEIPFRLTPGERTPYADLAGRGSAFATLDYSVAPPLLFLGKQVTLAQLGIKTNKRAEPKRVVAAMQLACPNCGGQLELRAPDKSERVTCPYCSSLLETKQGNLRFLEALKQPKHSFVLALGQKGKLFDIEWQVVGQVVRAVNYQGTKYPWEEYLLYHHAEGFRWLVQSEGHWSFGQPVNIAEVDASRRARYATYQGRSYRLYQDSTPFVEGVWGEFYWPVKKGEQVASSDYIEPPFMLSSEKSGKEINWTQLQWLPPNLIASAFAVKEMPRPVGVAPNQPYPHTGVFRWWKIFSLVVWAAMIAFCSASRETKVFESDFTLDPQAGQEATQVFFTDPFPLRGGDNLEVTVRSAVSNSWVYVQGDFVDEATGLVLSFDLPIEYYSGIDGGESWSEGGQEKQEYYSAPPGGNYSLRLEVMRGNFAQPATLHVLVRQGVARTTHFLLVWLVISLLPLWTLIRRSQFNVKRWSNSDHSPYG